MLGAVALAWLFPEPGARGGVLHPEIANKAGVALIFFLHGASLSFEGLKSGTLNFRLHLVVQLSTFVLLPLLGLIAYFATTGVLRPDLRLGIFYLCALPSTVSSSVALTAAARGNVAGALFNATASSLLGVFLTPLWLGLLLGSVGRSLPIGPVIGDLLLWLVLPLAMGQLARPWLGGFVRRHQVAVAVIDRVTILLLVYTSFCDSVQGGVWSNQSLFALVFTLGLSLLLLGVAMGSVGFASGRLGLSRSDRIAAVLCGSKKSLATGVPMAHLMFGAHAGLGLILLPIMIYHPLQLLVGGWLAGRWGTRVLREGEP
jgi:sodium/bile acid cotransporter 7